MTTQHQHTTPKKKSTETSVFVRFMHKLSQAGARAIPYPKYGHTIVK